MGLFDLWKFSKAYNKNESPAEYIKRVGPATAVLTFIRHAYEPGVRLCYEKGLMADYRWGNGDNVLHYAIKNCPDEKIIRYLVENDPTQLNMRNTYSKTPMHIAAECASVELNIFLYDMGGMPDIPDAMHKLPYYYAIMNRRANHVASLSLDKLQDMGKLSLLNGISDVVDDAKDAIENAKNFDESERYINCVNSYVERLAK